MNRFLWLARQTVHGIGWMWPISLFLLVSLAAAILYSRGSLRACVHPRRAWELLVLLNPVVLLFLGAAYACEDCSPSALGLGTRHIWAIHVANALVVGQLLAIIWWVWHAQSCRLFSAALHVLFLWCTLQAAFIAGMSLSGDWL